MKKLLLVLTALLVGCSITRDDLRPEEVQSFDELIQEEAAADAQLAEANASGDPVEIAEAQARKDAVEEALTAFETQVLRDRAGPIIGTIAQLAGPVGVSISPLLLGLVPLLGRRGRRHYGKAVARLNPFQKDPGTGEPGGIAPGEAVLDILRAIGVLHSSDSDRAADSAA